LQESEGLFAHGFPANTITINPVDAEAPVVASVDDAETG
jgi:hypothetical protein